jgi:hypothetical protein
MKKKRKKEKRVRVCENVTRSGCHSQALRAVCSLVQQKANPRGASIIGVLKQLSQDCMRSLLRVGTSDTMCGCVCVGG